MVKITGSHAIRGELAGASAATSSSSAELINAESPVMLRIPKCEVQCCWKFLSEITSFHFVRVLV